MSGIPGHLGNPGRVSHRRVLLAVAITAAAGGLEILGAWVGRSLFLVADTAHLLAHIGIFAILIVPAADDHGRREDIASLGVLAVVLAIATAIGAAAIRRLLSAEVALPDPAVMLLSLLGLGANVAVALLFRQPARTRSSFRAALTHELSDAALTVGGLAGALCIRLWRWSFVDPGLSLGIAAWLLLWAGRLLIRRLRKGPAAWAPGT